MHNHVVPASVKKRVLNRMGKLLANDIIEARRTALLVVDMQNYYCAPGFPLEVPMSREIVPNINRLSRALRAAGGVVVWIQMTAVGALQGWTNFHTRMLAPERQKNRLAGLDETSDSFNLFPTLEVLASDMRVKKIKYSAFAPGSSDIDLRLKSHGVDTILISGCMTNVCCDWTGRDAMQLDYKVIMLSDSTAALTDEEHAAALNTFMMFFGDAMSTDEAIARLAPVTASKTA